MKCKAVWISCILAALFCGRSANAKVIMTLDQVGPNVVATGSVTINFTDLTSFGGAFVFPFIDPRFAELNVVVGEGGSTNTYIGISGPRSFGSGSFTPTSMGTGNALSIHGGGSSPFIAVPAGYVSGTELSGTATWNNTTIAALGADPGTYTWTWGSGANADSLTLHVTLPSPARFAFLELA